MNIERAEHLGMCFGVRDAITLARRLAGGGRVRVLGPLVHNRTVVSQLESEGVEFVRTPDEVGDATALITAHGTSTRERTALASRGLEVADATCPLVHRAHEALARLVADGFHPVIVGLREHVEVRGLAGDHPEARVVLSEEEVDALAEHPRFGVVSQTTQPVARVRRLVERLRSRFPRSEVRWIDTVCRPTKERQEAAEDLAARCDVVVVIGGPASNNTRELAGTCRRHCARVHVIQSAGDLDPRWFRPEDAVGITAGTSTPDDVVDAVEDRLRRFDLTDPAPDPGRRIEHPAASPV